MEHSFPVVREQMHRLVVVHQVLEDLSVHFPADPALLLVALVVLVVLVELLDEVRPPLGALVGHPYLGETLVYSQAEKLEMAVQSVVQVVLVALAGFLVGHSSELMAVHLVASVDLLVVDQKTVHLKDQKMEPYPDEEDLQLILKVDLMDEPWAAGQMDEVRRPCAVGACCHLMAHYPDSDQEGHDFPRRKMVGLVLVVPSLVVLDVGLAVDQLDQD